MVNTFSIVATDRDTGEIGVAVASKFLAVGATVPWTRAGVGAVATQAWANATYGPEGLRLLAEGLSADEVLNRLVEPDGSRHRRQVGVVDAQGRAVAWTGEKCMSWAGHRTGTGYTCQGNLMAGPEVIEAMARTFEASAGPLPERLVGALEAGQAHGGDRRGQEAAALLVAMEGGSYGGMTDRYIDLRVDNADQPIVELRALLEVQRVERPLQTAVDEFVVAAHHDLDTVRARVERQPILVHARARWEENALEASAHTGRADIAQLLLAQGASLDICTAAMLGMKDRVQEFLRTDPALSGATGAHGIPVLFFPVIAGRREIAELLLASGADVNAETSGMRPLHGAAAFGQAEMAQWLLDHGAHVDVRDQKGKTALQIAVEKGHETVAVALRSRGAE